MYRKLSVSIVLIVALSLVVGAMFFTNAPTTYGTPSTKQPNDHKSTPDPCKAAGNCGTGDTGHGNPTKALPNCNAMQGEPDQCKTKAPKATDVPVNTKTPPTDVPKATATHVPQATATNVPQATPTSAPQSTPTDMPRPTATDDPKPTPPTTDTPHVYVTPHAGTPQYTPLIGKYTQSTGCPAIKCGCLSTIVVTETTTVWADRGITQTLKVTTYTYESGSGQ